MTSGPSAPTEQATRGRGRPRQFDRDQVVDELVELFWTNGFETTGLSDITAATGLNKSSLYRTFGSKDELFAEVLHRYMTMRSGLLQQIVIDGEQGLADIQQLIDFMELETAGDGGARGCLAVNTTTELGLSEHVAVSALAGFRATMREAIGVALGRAAAAGETDPAASERQADMFLGMWLGTGVLSRGQGHSPELQRHFEAMRALVESWRLP